MGLRISIGYHHWGTVHARFMSSVCRAMVYEGRKVSDIIDIPSPYVAEARNKIVHVWLSQTKSRYLLMLDADIEFPEDAISKIAFIAETYGLPILGGCYSLGDFGNSIFAGSDDSFLVRPLLKIQPNVIYRNVGGVATGFLLIRRDAAEQIKAGNTGPWYWFDHDPEPIVEGSIGFDEIGFLKDSGFTKMGEDMSFCARARKLGIEVCGTTYIPLIHHKMKPTVPKDLLSLFEGQKVFTQESPWILENEKLKQKKEEEEGQQP